MSLQSGNEENLGVRIKEGYEGLVVAGCMFVVAFALIAALKLLLH